MESGVVWTTLSRQRSHKEQQEATRERPGRQRRERGAGGAIPPDSWLLFDVEVLSAEADPEPAFSTPSAEGTSTLSALPPFLVGVTPGRAGKLAVCARGDSASILSTCRRFFLCSLPKGFSDTRLRVGTAPALLGSP